MHTDHNIYRGSANLSDLFIVFVKRLAVLPVEEGGDAHDFLLLVDDRQRQAVFDDEARLVHGLFLQARRKLETREDASFIVCFTDANESNVRTWNVKKSSAATFIMLQICREVT